MGPLVLVQVLLAQERKAWVLMAGAQPPEHLHGPELRACVSSYGGTPPYRMG